VEESSAEWATLETFARHGVQRLLQQVLEEEVDEPLGRRRYERRAVVDAAPGYRNGFGRPRAAESEQRHDHLAPAARPWTRGAVRESDPAAVQAADR